MMTAYIASLLLAIFPQLVAASLTNIFGNWDFNRVLDPVGILGIVGAEMATWSVPEKNYRLVQPEGMFLLNKILWFFVAVGLLIFTYFRFSFAHPVTKSWFGRFKRKSKASSEISADTGIIRAAAISVPKVQQNFGFGTYISQTLTIAWASFKKIATHPLGLTLVGAIAIISAAFGDLIINEQGIQLLPTTQQVISYFTAPVSNIGSPWVIIPLLIMFFTGELIWLERDKGINDIADAALSTRLGTSYR
ncbi:hypothetical protein LZ575_02935 [Antarcticibacterium sp. 1MA-6-2]|uniref:hypothetical protein n=1 Tax=Antarcticibacterium sp. 1MA-6-2 TaxID=2908210 RepID=UPI001F3DCBDC|nr:hypothetical protein [Antarcticibacterium sp. 1MA-6-2]UJH91660.1 hypothetical protein LZ575_02935 [Antarcticibacterium sp. 1MA-6-2]